MSSSLTLRLSTLIWGMREKEYKFSKHAAITSGCAMLTNLCYALITRDNSTVKIVEKYKFDSNGFTNFMVVDASERHYRVSNSVWYNKWDSVEDYSKIKEDTYIDIKYYGFRIPILGIFPNIYHSVKCK